LLLHCPFAWGHVTSNQSFAILVLLRVGGWHWSAERVGAAGKGWIEGDLAGDCWLLPWPWFHCGGNGRCACAVLPPWNRCHLCAATVRDIIAFVMAKSSRLWACTMNWPLAPLKQMVAGTQRSLVRHRESAAYDGVEKEMTYCTTMQPN
jgi:hypothetical protein